jgi:cytochrome c peroxidase
MCRSAEPNNSEGLDWQIPSEKLKLSFKEDAPIVFVSRNQLAEWEKLPTFWNEGTEKIVDPRTNQEVTRRVVRIKMPLGLNAPQTPPENPLTVAKWILGKRLYFDSVLSSDGTVACASCHSPAKGFTDQLRFSIGIGSQAGGISAPTVINSAFHALQFWDGRAATLEDQAQGPVQNPIEMFDGKGNPWHSAVMRVRAKGDYKALFEQAFGAPPTRDSIAKAIASYERTVFSGNSITDRAELAMRIRIDDDGGKPEVLAKDYLKVLKEALTAKDESALSAIGVKNEAGVQGAATSLANGRTLFFGKARCNSCHVGENYTDNQFHNLGVGVKDGKLAADAHGRFVRQPTGHKNFESIGAFKTPTIRSLLTTAPYLHDGSEDSLEKVVEFYDRGGNANEFLDTKMRDFDAERKARDGQKLPGIEVKRFGAEGKPVIPLKLSLTADEKKDLVLFMKSLQGEAIDPIVADPKKLPSFPGK